MVVIKRIVLDVLKPHQPNALEFAREIAGQCGECRVVITVAAVDEKTENIVVVVEGPAIDFDAATEAIAALGGSVHSIDEVEVEGAAESEEE